MKKLTILLVSIAAILGGCATNAIKPATPAQLVAQFCPIAKAIDSQVALIPSLDPAISAKLNAAAPFISDVCSEGAVVTALNFSDLSTKGMPLLLSAVSALPIAASPQGQTIIIGLDISQVLLSQLVVLK